jgi:phage replication-related protein YjqB (UPF0714/DUF867 family)
MYGIRLLRRDSPVAIIAPHGGKIERCTSEIAEKIAGDAYNFFAFEGKMRRDNWDMLHVTSTSYDEPHCRNLIATCDIVLAIHGAGDTKAGDRTVYIGGANREYKAVVKRALDDASIPNGVHLNPRLQGTDADNICNRGLNPDGGVQLEISATLRDDIVNPEAPGKLTEFAAAINVAIQDMIGH